MIKEKYSSSNKTSSQWGAYLIGIAIPLALFVLWQNADIYYPSSDAGDYFSTTSRIYYKYKTHGLTHAFFSAYVERGWKPIIFPVFAVPSLLMSGGDIAISVSLTMGLFYSIFLTYAYLIALEFLPPWRSMLCTIFLGTTPWIFNITNEFMSEMPVMAISIASVYHLKKSDFFGSLRHSVLVGLWMAIGFSIRPVELSMSFGLPLIVMLYLSWKKQNVGGKDILVSVAVFFITCILLLAGSFFPGTRLYYLKIVFWLTLFITLFILSFSPFILRKRLGLNLPYIAAFCVCNFLAGIWWLPYVRGLYSWVYECSFGPMAKLYPGYGKTTLFEAFAVLFSFLGGYPLLFLAVLIILALWGTRQNRKLVMEHLMLLVSAFSMIFIVIVMISFANGVDLRRAYVGFSIFLLATFIVAIKQKFIFSNIRLVILTLLVIAQVSVVFGGTFNITLPVIPIFFKNIKQPHRDADLSLMLFEKINELSLGRKRIAVFSQSNINTFTLRALSEKFGGNLQFNYPWNFIELKDGYKILYKEYDFVILDITEPPLKDKDNLPVDRLYADIYNKWKMHEFDTVGLNVVSEFNVLGNRVLLIALKHYV